LAKEELDNNYHLEVFHGFTVTTHLRRDNIDLPQFSKQLETMTTKCCK